MLMSRILAFQAARRRFYMKNKDAGFRDDEETIPRTSLPKKMADRVAQLGTLNLKTGRIKVRPALKKILKKHKVWRAFR